ncbi:hypothetical protein ILYODFUR_031617 [Ilyodon furcidens]|uniref:Uncharacterized protein n=1 Tax=Ilyodon furcidens TaxID=33524 RepID=A0ABV0T1X2_9TELE
MRKASAGNTTGILCRAKRRAVSQLRALLLILCLYSLYKSLWGPMPERFCYSLDSYHSNQGAWQLMFHLQINYSKLLMEENVSFFSFSFSGSEISFWCNCVTLAPFP